MPNDIYTVAMRGERTHSEQPKRVKVINGDDVEEFDNYIAAQEYVWDFITGNASVAFEMTGEDEGRTLVITLV